MDLYDISGFPDYKVTDTCKLYGIYKGCRNKLSPTESGGYVMYNDAGRWHLTPKKIMALADLPYTEDMHIPKKYTKATPKEIRIRRDLEDKLWERDNNFSW